MKRFTVYAAIAVALMLLLLTCQKQAGKEDDKPSDLNEGVPGYLVDPAMISIAESGGSVTITAPAGTVVSHEAGESVYVQAAQVAVEVLGESDLSADSLSFATTAASESVEVSEDGSFTISGLANLDDDPFIVAVSSLPDALNQLSITEDSQARRSGVLMDWRLKYVRQFGYTGGNYLYLCDADKIAATSLFDHGEGSEADPYVICSLAQLQEVKDRPAAYYLLGRDIDATETKTWIDEDEKGEGFFPIPSTIITPGPHFTGTFDGTGKTISNLYINRPYPMNVGLFGIIGEGGKVANLRIENADITAERITGVLAGRFDGREVSNIIVTGKIFSASGIVGLLIGSHAGGLVEQAWVKGTVVGDDGFHVGGLIGVSEGSESEVRQVGAEVHVTGEQTTGGLIGTLRGASVRDCYAVGVVIGRDYEVGGLLGNYRSVADANTEWMVVENCFAATKMDAEQLLGETLSRFIGTIYPDTAPIVNSFFQSDTECIGTCTDIHGIPKTGAELKDQATFEGWDFTTPVWTISDGAFPRLAAFPEVQEE